MTGSIMTDMKETAKRISDDLLASMLSEAVNEGWEDFALALRELQSLRASRHADAQEGGEVAIPAEVTARYWNMIPHVVQAKCEPDPGTSRSHIKWMLQELRTMTDFGKAMRWLGFVQGIMIEHGYTTVKAERDFTRPFFAAPSNPVVSDEMVEQVFQAVAPHIAGTDWREVRDALTAALSVKPRSGSDKP